MQVTFTIPDDIPQEVVNRMLMQFEKQIQIEKKAVLKLVSFNEAAKEIRNVKSENKPLKRQAGLGRGSVWMSDDFDAPLPDSFWLGDDL